MKQIAIIQKASIKNIVIKHPFIPICIAGINGYDWTHKFPIILKISLLIHFENVEIFV